MNYRTVKGNFGENGRNLVIIRVKYYENLRKA